MTTATGTRRGKPTQVQGQRWRSFWVGFLIALGSIALSNWLILRWMELYVFDTQTYVETVAPTKDPAVANALSAYATEKLYSSIDLEAEIRNALPEKASFLAAPLAGQVEVATEKIGTRLIASDQFNSIWIAANQNAHSALIATLEKPQPEFNAEKERVVFGINISPFLEQIRTRLQSSDAATITPTARMQQTGQLAISLREQVQTMRAAYQYSQAMYVLLPLLTIACYLAAIAIASSRWRAVLAISITVTVVTAIELILLKAARPEVLSQVATEYQAAAAVVWDTMTAGFKNVTTNTMLVGVALTVVTMLAGPFSWAQRLRKSIGLDRLRQTKFFAGIREIRNWFRQYIFGIRIGGIVLAFIVLIIKPGITWQTVAMAILAYFIYLSTVELIATRKTN
jgi:hypothetical protein